MSEPTKLDETWKVLAHLTDMRVAYQACRCGVCLANLDLAPEILRPFAFPYQRYGEKQK